LNRSLVTFLLFLCLLVGGGALLAWWVGPAMISLALDDERRGAPYYVIHLLDAQDPAGYFQTFGGLLREEEAQLLWRGSLQALHSGRTQDEIGDVAVIEFGAGSSVVQMLTSSAYRQLTATDEPILLGSALPPGPIAHDENLVLWLVEVVEGGDVAELEALGSTAGEYQGQLIWSAAIDVLDGERRWNHALLIAFPDGSALSAWLNAPATTTDRALVRRQHASEAMLELRSG
jgi:uncharacterized protein (DUF1330 family)